MLAVGIPSSELPRPKPFTMGPDRRRGKGGEGVSGPAMRERGVSGRIDIGIERRKVGGFSTEAFRNSLGLKIDLGGVGLRFKGFGSVRVL